MDFFRKFQGTQNMQKILHKESLLIIYFSFQSLISSITPSFSSMTVFIPQLDEKIGRYGMNF